MSETLSERRPRKRDAQATRARILAAAVEHFARGSYEKVSLRDISSEAGVDVAIVGCGPVGRGSVLGHSVTLMVSGAEPHSSSGRSGATRPMTVVSGSARP